MSVCSRDDAYRRKFLKSVKYNPDRVVSPPWQVEASDQLHQAVEQEKPLGPLGTHSVKTIMRLGVSDEETAEQLRHIPFDALEAALIDLCNKGIVDVISMDNLYKLANGAPLSEILSPAEINEDIQEILLKAPARDKLWKPRDIEELKKVLRHPWERWLVYLSSTQRELGEALFKGAARVTGGPGTGKTIVGVYRAVYLAVYRYPDSRIFLTTFTKALAKELKRRANLL